MLMLHTARRRPLAAALLVALGLAGCASGSNSFVAGQPGGGSSDAADNTAFDFDGSTSPNVLIAGGNALLPGARSPAADALLGQSGAAGAATASLSSGSPLANGAVGQLANQTTGAAAGLLNQTTGAVGAAINGAAGALTQPATRGVTVGLPVTTPVGGANATVNAALTGPLLSLNGGQTALLGASGSLGSAPAANTTLAVGGGTSPQAAISRLLISVSGATMNNNGSGAGGAGTGGAGTGGAGSTGSGTGTGTGGTGAGGAGSMLTPLGVPGSQPLGGVIGGLVPPTTPTNPIGGLTGH